MKCDRGNSMALLWLNNELLQKDRQAFEEHIGKCATCREELTELQVIFTAMENIRISPPSSNMQDGFSEILNGFIRSANRPSVWKSAAEKLRSEFGWRPGLRLVYSLSVLVIGIFTGYLLFHRSVEREQLNTLSKKLDDMRETMILALLDNASPGERMRAVSYAEEAGSMDQKLADALFITLNEDPNVNVRLATIDALARYGKDPEVRQKLVQSLLIQESPLVLSALADIMLRFREKTAVHPLRSLLKKQELSAPVKKKIEKIIQTLDI